MRTDMNIQNRLEILEATNRPEVPLEWTPEEREFIIDIDNRRREKGTKNYHEVCSPDEFERIKRLSTKACLIWYRDKQKNKSNESE